MERKEVIYMAKEIDLETLDPKDKETLRIFIDNLSEANVQKVTCFIRGLLEGQKIMGR